MLGFVFQTYMKYCLDIFNQEIKSAPKKIKNLGDPTIASFFAEMLVQSPRKLYNFVIFKKNYLDQRSKNKMNLFSKTEALDPTDVYIGW